MSSPDWDDVYGPVSEQTAKSEIISQMIDVNEALASAIRSRDTGTDWVITPDGNVSRVQVSAIAAKNICLILEMRLELLASMLLNSHLSYRETITGPVLALSYSRKGPT